MNNFLNSGEKTVLVTGASGMIGSALISQLVSEGYNVLGLDCKEKEVSEYRHIVLNLSDKEKVVDLFSAYKIHRVIHLAALAHTAGEKDLSYEKYFEINVKCAANVFEAAFLNKVPVLYISTADVYGFVNGVATAKTPLKPVSNYGKTKALAENELKALSTKFEVPYTIYRFAPVYTNSIKRDIQKRYYFKYPNLAYIVGKGTDYEFLNIDNAVKQMSCWLNEKVNNDIHNIKDENLINTAECIKKEKSAGRARFVIHLPNELARLVFNLIKIVFGENKYTYLLNKAINPLRTD